MKRLAAITLILYCMSGGGAHADIIHADDVIINGGSLCVGIDCVNGEVFGEDTIRLKENNLRIHFDDTSNSASFPNNDWRLIANDSTNGGLNHFAIEDATAGRQIFKVEAGARSNALYVEQDGDIGIGTSNPAVDVHVQTGDTPTYRMAQDGSSGFTPQTWDVAGNDANFFIRDVTNGSRLVLRIRPGAPTDSLHILANGNVGMGVAAATEPLHVRRTDSAGILVENTTGTPAQRTLMKLENAGNTRFSMENTDAAVEWLFLNSAAGTFRISDVENPNTIEFNLDQAGNLTTSGTVNGVSDRNAKTDFTAVDAQEVLAKVVALPVSQWTYRHDRGVRHMGPVSQDFRAAFDLGQDDLTIALSDLSGVALAAIQGLNEKLAHKQYAIDELRKQNVQLKLEKDQQVAALKDELDELRQMLLALAAKERVALSPQ